ncbi:HTH domain-containing protein [Streptomyces cyaneochromogenes]|uniref:HTH domain-containing protein n=1 Tax=Streptomyces cyaneochromogenes TaxID=2496836 RepID=A0A3S9MKW9_9ACTN|nr:HTH domain-containing protein [Streptomyces cyaneochromogenes]
MEITTSDTTSRVLRLLPLLQTRRGWSGADLADRLGFTVRTVHRDIDRGYRLAAGADLPPPRRRPRRPRAPPHRRRPRAAGDQSISPVS